MLVLTETGGVFWSSGTGASYNNVANNVQLWTASGLWVGASSRTLKENFTPLDSNDILQKIDQLEVTRWNYKSEGKSITHIGPVAEDFYRIFKAGYSEKKLAIIDEAGVALAEVKALSNTVKVQQREIESLKSEIQKLSKSIN